MTDVLAIPLEDGGTVLVEIDETDGGPGGGVVKAGRPGELMAQAAQSLDAALAPVATAARAALRELRRAGPDEVTVEFGVQFRAELGAVIARSSGECNLKVTMRWGRADDPTGNRQPAGTAPPASDGEPAGTGQPAGDGPG